MPSKNDKRRKKYVDAVVQGAILRQALSHWLAATMVFAGTVFIFRVIPHWVSGEALDGRTLWFYFAPMAFSSAVFLPMICNRAVQFSHRFVGPMVRFRSAIVQLSRGEDTEEISLRNEDFWKDVAHDLNALASRMREESDLRSELQQLFPAAQDGAATELQPVPASLESLEKTSESSEPSAPLEEMSDRTEEALNAC